VIGSTVFAVWLKETKESLSTSVSELMMVRTPCFATPRRERPLLSVVPEADWIVASMPMDPEVSMTRQMSAGCRFSPGGGCTVIRTSPTPSLVRPWVIATATPWSYADAVASSSGVSSAMFVTLKPQVDTEREGK
jgi:hypothetical protein